MADGLIRRVDCVSMPVADLSAAVRFYREGLGHDLIWRSKTAAGFGLPDTETELVVHTEPRPAASELLVRSVPSAVQQFVEAGGTLITGPFDIAIGQCAEVSDPWGNTLALLDMSKGPLKAQKRLRLLVGPFEADPSSSP